MKKGTLILAVALIAVFAMGMMILSQKKKDSYRLPQSEKQDQDVQMQQVEDAKGGEEVTNTTSASKTYRNESYGFEFQYPEAFVLDEVNSEVDFSKEYGAPNGSVTTFRYVLLKSLDVRFVSVVYVFS